MHKNNYKLSWISWSILVAVGVVNGADKVNKDGAKCDHPPVPAAATYVNVTGGLGEQEWVVRYICDNGYELFGKEKKTCKDGAWKGDSPHCAVNVARYKPAVASSENGEGKAANAVDGVPTIVHEGRKCSETKSEKSPWWTVDLLSVQAVKHVRITTRCCDDLPIKNVEIRVGNSTVYKDNPLCNWLPGTQKEGDTILVECVTDDTSGRYVSLLMTGASAVLSLCEVEVFTPNVLGTASCSSDIDQNQLAVYDDSCFWFVDSVKKENGETDVLGFTEASQTCDAIGYHLADEIDQIGADFIKTRMEAEGRANRGTMVWLGANRDPQDGKDSWKWVSGKSVRHIFWGSQQPNNYNNEQNCAVLDSQYDWRWNDLSCKVDAKTVCRGELSRCSSPPVNDGTWYTGEMNLGSTIQYHCPLGSKPMGQSTQVCRGNGKWSGEPITCKFVDCENVRGLLNGAVHVIDGRTTWGARIKYKCNTDYSLLNGDERRICAEDGWTGTAPTCEYTKCPDPALVNNAELKEIAADAGKNRLGAKVIYTCQPGHVARGSLSRECLLGGEWSGSEPSCDFVDCRDPPELLNGDVELLDRRTTYGAEVRYSCGDDYIMKGETERRCEANGRWTKAKTECKIINCPAPRAPTGGRVSGYNYEVHRKVEYSCMPGHTLIGDPVLQCLRTGQWSARSPRCRYIDCERVADIDGGSVIYINETTHLGSVIKFHCKKSYSLAGPKEIVCQDTGKWSKDSPTCTEIRCALPTRPNNTVVSISSRSSTERLHGTSVIRTKFENTVTYRVGSQLKYRCERGYLLEGGDRVSSRRCTTDATWTGKTPSCSYVDCGIPDIIPNGEFKLQNNGTSSYGSMVFYDCQTGWKLKGFDKRSCQSTGRWSPEAPTCEETLCPKLVTPEKSVMNLTTLRIGGQATFTCEHGYKLVGDADIQCLSSGSWSAWPPACVEIDCGQPYNVDNSRMFLVNESTKYGSVVEYLCVPGYTREGPFQRTCDITGYWSGQDPVCFIPRKVPVTPLISNKPFDGTTNVISDNRENDNGGIGVWIGVGLGLIVVIGLIIVGVYFYRKQLHLQSKPTRDNNANGLGVLGVPSYAVGSYGANQIGARPPPPIQMYSIDDSPDDHRGPIYDTINDDNSSHSQSTYSQSGGSDHAYPRSTFNPVSAATSDSGYNNGYNNEYDVPEGNERPGSKNKTQGDAVGTVTINGIAV